MAELPFEGVEVNKLAENDAEVPAVEFGASAASATDGKDTPLESARDPTTNADSLSASPVESFETGFYKVRFMRLSACRL